MVNANRGHGAYRTGQCYVKELDEVRIHILLSQTLIQRLFPTDADSIHVICTILLLVATQLVY